MGTRTLSASGLVLLVIALLSVSAWAGPGVINYQGKLTDGTGTPLNGTYTMQFVLYDPLTGGTPVWSEEQSVAVTAGIYNVQLGSVSPFTEDLFDTEEVYLGVAIYNADTESWEYLVPRQRFTSVAYAFQADNARALEGHGSADFAPSVHQHSGTDITSGTVDEARIGADIARDSELTWGNLSGIPADIADGDQVGITAETDPTITNPSVKDGVSWAELSGIPSDFADNVDNDSGGDITGVTAGTGLSGGGVSGNVTLDVSIPLNLSGSESGGLISASNTNSEGIGVYGHATGSNGYGVSGEASDPGLVENYGGHFAAAGGAGRGVYGQAYYSGDATNYGGYFKADGTYGRGVFGWASGTYGVGVRGMASNGEGVLNWGGYFDASGSSGRGVSAEAYGTNGIGVFGSASNQGDGENYGGYFEAMGAHGRGVYGLAHYGGNATTYGGFFTANGTLGRGIYAEGANTGDVRNFGGYFRVKGRDGWGVFAEAQGTNGIGVYGKATSATGYDFFAGGAGANYGAFTGAHEVRFAEDMPREIQPGMIVSASGRAEKRVNDDGGISLSSTLPTVTITQKAMDKAVLGVLLSAGPLHEDHWYEAQEGERFGVVNALGEGRMWVTNTYGDIEAGDYVTSSDIPGYGQRQEDDLVHSYTVGKAIEAVDWDAIEETIEYQGQQVKVYLIAVVYTSG